MMKRNLRIQKKKPPIRKSSHNTQVKSVDRLRRSRSTTTELGEPSRKIKPTVVALLSTLLLTSSAVAQQGGMDGMQVPTLSPEEMRLMMVSQAGEHAKTMIQEFDEDQDRELNWTEFKNASELDQNAVESLRTFEEMALQEGTSLPDEYQEIISIEDDDEAFAALEKLLKEKFDAADVDGSHALSEPELAEHIVQVQLEMTGLVEDDEEDSEEADTEDSEE